MLQVGVGPFRFLNNTLMAIKEIQNQARQLRIGGGGAVATAPGINNRFELTLCDARSNEITKVYYIYNAF